MSLLAWPLNFDLKANIGTDGMSFVSYLLKIRIEQLLTHHQDNYNYKPIDYLTLAQELLGATILRKDSGVVVLYPNLN